MKCLTTILFVHLIFFGNSQLEFGEVQDIDRSFNFSEPYFVKNANGYELFNIGKQTIYIDSYGNDLSTVKKFTLDLPDEIRKHEQDFMFDEKLYLLKFTMNCELLVYRVDIEQRSYEKVSQIKISRCLDAGIKPGCEWYCSVNQDGSLLLTFSSGQYDQNQNKKWVISVLAINKDLKTVKYKFSIPEPPINESRAIVLFQEAISVGNDDFILKYKSKATSLLNRSNYINYYKYVGDSLNVIWTYSQSRIEDENSFAGEPEVFLNDKNEFRYLLPVLESGDSENITIYIKDENDKDVQKFETNLVLPELTSDKIMYNAVVFPIDHDYSKCRILITLRDGNEIYGKHPEYFINLLIEGNNLTEQYLINGENTPTLGMNDCIILDDKIISTYDLMILEGDQVYSARLKDVFKKVSSAGVTYNFVIDDNIFTLHSEYSAINLKSQLVKWKRLN